ncbi:single-stranded DNA-binding protein [Patescibacteria group bacterium]|nr:single-stranded DNA-binding protein [Patescibacteria group bacterium]
MNLNKAMIIGNLTRDPETRNLSSGQTVASFSVATNRRWKDKQTGENKDASEFHNIVAWGKLADICNQYLKKGSKVYLEGRLQTRSWDDQSGTKKYRTEIVAENMIMLDRAGSVPQTNTASQPKPSEEPKEEEISVEDIPF